MKKYIFLVGLLALSCKKEKNEPLEEPAPTATQVTDIDGNVYATVQIGTIVWMAQNLKTTKYSNGTEIPNVTDNAQWSNLTTGAYCEYENNPAYGNSDGKLYNWNVINTSNVCPSGWHIPSISEWSELSDFLGGNPVSGKKLKSATAIFSPYFDPTGTNESGFSGIPAGSRYIDGNFSMKGSFGLFWSSTAEDSLTINYTSLSGEDELHFGTAKKMNAFSIRCVKN